MAQLWGAHPYLAATLVGVGILASTQLLSSCGAPRPPDLPVYLTATAQPSQAASTVPAVASQQPVATSSSTLIPLPNATSTPPAGPVTPRPDVVTFISRTVLVASGGSEPGQLALDKLVGWPCPVVGPADFDVDAGGSIHIVDGLNYRVSKYNSSGKYVSSFGYPHPNLRDAVETRRSGAVAPSAIALAEDGSTFLAYRGLVKKFDASGRFVFDFGQVQGQLDSVNSLTVSRAGRVLLFGQHRETWFTVYDLGSTQEPAAMLKSNPVPTTLGPTKAFAGISRDGYIEGLESITEDRMSAQLHVRLPDGGDRILDIAVAGYTGQGFYVVAGGDMLYVVAAVQEQSSSQVQERILAYDSTQWLATFRPVDGPMNECLLHRFRTSPDGRLYQMLIYNDQVVLVGWDFGDQR